jgi:hypothetical protein
MAIKGIMGIWKQKAATLAWVALGFVLLAHLWGANRGLEMTDEASYFLIALDPWRTWGHGTFHGFLLRPLYLLGGSSVVGLRWIGFGVLLFAGWRLAGAVRLRLGQGKLAVGNFCSPVMMVAAMTCYSAGMRTPCYNWMILVGAILAWSGWLRSGISGIGPFELGVGLAISFVGKWGAALVLLAMFVGLSYSLKGRSLGPKRREWIAALSMMFVGVGSFAIYAGGAGIRDTIQAGILIAKTTGSHGWFILPKYGWEIFYYLYRIARAFIWLLPAILIFWWLNKRDCLKWGVTKISTILFVAGLSLGTLRGWWRGGIEQFGKESVLAGCWLLGVAWTVWAVRRKSEPEERRTGEGGQNPFPRCILWALVLTPFLCGFGTNTSIADYAGQGTVFFVATGIFLLGALSATSIPSVAAVSLAGLCLIQASRVSSSLLGMYRLGSVFEQTETVKVGPEAGRLKVDAKTLGQIEAIHRILRKERFQAGTAIIGVDSLCGWVYLSGGKSPGVPWFFIDQKSYLSEVLKVIPPQLLEQSWVWVRSSSKLKDIQSWWPSRGIGFPSRQAGEVSFLTDRGDEILRLFSPQP